MSPTTWPFVGRDDVLREVRGRLDEGRHVVLTGAAGLGKTRLAHEITESYAASGTPVVRVVASPATAPLPLAPLASLVGGAVGGDAVAAAQRTIAALGRQFPAHSPAHSPAQSPAHSARWSAQSNDRPNGSPGGATTTPLLSVDDLHLLDEASAIVVHQLITGGSVRLLATVRSSADCPPAVDRLRQAPGVDHVTLGTLADADIAAMVERALGSPLSGHARGVIVGAAAGNPMYARELVEGSLAAGAMQRHGGVYGFEAEMVATPLLEEVVLARLAPFDGAERSTLELLAVGGRLEQALVERVVGFEPLERLERVGIVVADTGEGRPGGLVLDLGHPLYRELTRARLGALARMRIYRTLAEADADSSESTRSLDEQLRSAVWSVRGGLSIDPAILSASAHRAVAIGNTPLAAELAHEASSRTGTTADALLASWCLSLNGDHARAITVLRTARETETDPWMRAALRLRIAEEHWWFGDLDAGLAVLDEATGEPGPWDALVHAQRSAHAAMAGNLPVAVQLGLPLVEHPHPWVRFVAAVGYCLGLIFSDDAEKGLAASRALSHSLIGVDVQPVGDPGQHHAIQILGMLATGDLDQAREAAEAAYAAAQLSPSQQARAWAAMLVGLVTEVTGDVTACVRALAEAERLWSTVRVWGFAVWCGAALARAQAESGDLDEAAVTLQRVEGFPRPPQMLCGHLLDLARAWVAFGTGDRAGAAAHVEASVQHARATHAPANEAEAWHEAARLGVLDLLDPAAGPSGWSRPRSALAAARFDLVDARRTGEPAAWERAAAGFASLGAHGYAAEAASGAAAAYRKVGASRDAARMDAVAGTHLARTAGLVTPLVARRTGTGPLTAREAEIARLAAGRLSNRQIAEHLVVSERTVENHLYRIFIKLAVTGRDDLATALAGVADDND
ncbi:MAG: AAA family ATPase [Actinomycetales bacterium]|nr:AAA family ATPase [Candidatus Phosphoribacter baldrii]